MQRFLNKITCGDCMDFLSMLPDKSVDAVITDPPYSTTAYEWDTFNRWPEWWSEIKRVCRGRVVCHAAMPFTVDIVNTNRKDFKYWWIWSKGRPGNVAIAKFQPLRVTEEIVVFCDGPYYPQMSQAKPENMRPRDRQKDSNAGNIIKLKSGLSNRGENHNEDLRYPTTLLDFPSGAAECNNFNRSHPTQKPESLAKYLVATYTLPGQIVLDPFSGSGTTAAAAKDMERQYIGFELNPEYCTIGEARTAQEVLSFATV